MTTDKAAKDDALSGIVCLAFAGQLSEASQQWAALDSGFSSVLAVDLHIIGRWLTWLSEPTSEASIPAASTQLQHLASRLALGAWLAQCGRSAEALNCLPQPSEDNPLFAWSAAWRGVALLAVGQAEDALICLQKATTAEPGPVLAGMYTNLAYAALLSKQADIAQQALHTCADWPDKNQRLWDQLHLQCLAESGQHDAALLAARSLADQWTHADSLVCAIEVLAHIGQHDEALSLAADHRDKLEANDRGRLDGVVVELLELLGRHYVLVHYVDQRLKEDDSNLGNWCRLVSAAARFEVPGFDLVAATARIDALSAEAPEPERLQALLTLAEHAQHAHQPELMQQYLTQAEQLAPDSPELLSQKGRVLLESGHVQDAMACLERLKTIAPLRGWLQLIQANKLPDDPAVFEQLELLARRPSLQGAMQSGFLFALAAAYDKKGDSAKAIGFADEANTAVRKLIRYSPQEHRQSVDDLLAYFSPARLTQWSGFGLQTQLPVYVVGMPRSSTTLVESLLAAHSQVFGAGELGLVPQQMARMAMWERHLGSGHGFPALLDDLTPREATAFATRLLGEMQELAPAATRIVDKLPHNFENIGLIKLLFPKARIIWCRREARDIAVSNYFIDFQARHGGMGFAYDFGWIGEQIVDHERLMARWLELYGDDILPVPYEELVADTETWARRMLAHVGLEWEPGVLSFQNNPRQVKTASIWQVRQPVYTSSRERWRKYQAHLGPLEVALAHQPPAVTAAPIRQQPPGQFLAGMAALKQNKPQEALAFFDILLAERPEHAAALHFAGAAELRLGRLAQSHAHMQHSLALMPQQSTWRANFNACTHMLIGSHIDQAALLGGLGETAQAQAQQNIALDLIKTCTQPAAIAGRPSAGQAMHRLLEQLSGQGFKARAARWSQLDEAFIGGLADATGTLFVGVTVMQLPQVCQALTHSGCLSLGQHADVHVFSWPEMGRRVVLSSEPVLPTDTVAQIVMRYGVDWAQLARSPVIWQQRCLDAWRAGTDVQAPSRLVAQMQALGLDTTGVKHLAIGAEKS